VTYEPAPWAGRPLYITAQHGNQLALAFHRNDPEETQENFRNTGTLASELRNRRSFEEVRAKRKSCLVMASCKAGHVDGGIAQQAADDLGMTVWGANCEVVFYPNERAPLVLWKRNAGHVVKWVKFKPQSRRARLMQTARGVSSAVTDFGS